MHHLILFAVVIFLLLIIIDKLYSIPSTLGKSISESFGDRIVNKSRVVRLHYTNWCGACKLMKPVWAQVKASASGSGIIFQELDEDMAKSPGITSYPTICSIDIYGKTLVYKGGPVFDDLLRWVMAPTPAY